MHLRGIFAALVIVCACPRARAQLPTEADVRAAQQHAQKGRAYFDAGRYPRAVQELEAAYKLEPDPELQYRIAEAHRLNDEDELAIAAYRRYLDSDPDGPDAHNAHRHLRELGAERKSSGKKRAAVAATPRPAPAPPPEPAPPPPAPSLAPPPPQVDLTTRPPERHPRAPLSKRNFWIIVGTSAGVAAVIVLGVGLGVGLSPHETVFTEVRP